MGIRHFILLTILALSPVGMQYSLPAADAKPSPAAKQKSTDDGVGIAKNEKESNPANPQRPSRKDLDKRRPELRELPPAEREAKLKEYRDRNRKGRFKYRNMTPEQRKAKRLEFKKRLEAKIRELREKQKAGTLNTNEQSRLQHMMELIKRFEAYAATNKTAGQPGPQRQPKRP